MKTKIRFGFRSKNQAPWFMVWKKWIDENGEVDFGKVLFRFFPTEKKWLSTK